MKFSTIDQTSSAHLSDCGTYRYGLFRELPGADIHAGPYITWIMLNPSTADHLVNDPTIRRCISFSKNWGFKRIAVVNLFALRSTDPSRLKTHPDPIGPENDSFISECIAKASKIVCAWGNHGAYRKRAGEVLSICRQSGKTPHCLGVTKQGQPRHPLYLKQNQKLEVYNPEILNPST